MDAVRRLTEAGVSVWLDPQAPAGAAGEDVLSWLARSHVTGVGPSLPDERCAPAEARAAASPLARTARLAERLADRLGAVQAAGGGRDGLVAVPSPPAIRDDAQALVALGDELAALTGATNLVIGLPFDTAGLAAAAELVFRGLPIALGPVCSPSEYRRAGAVHRSALQRRHAAGRSVSGPPALAWIPVGGIDDCAAQQLLGRRPVEQLGGVGVTIAELIYLESFQVLSDPRWQPLRDAGADPLRPAFCHMPATEVDDDLRRLILPGSILALGRRAIGAIGASADLPLAEPDETQATWTLRQARRAGLPLVAMGEAMRLRFAACTRPA